jgi:hypothetical protein
LLSIDTGNCGPGEFRDLDGNGTIEFITCDDRWGCAHCSFAESPFPSVVFAYDAARGEYTSGPSDPLEQRDRAQCGLDAWTVLAGNGFRHSFTMPSI